jgi:hypothetical protein
LNHRSRRCVRLDSVANSSPRVECAEWHDGEQDQHTAVTFHILCLEDQASAEPNAAPPSATRKAIFLAGHLPAVQEVRDGSRKVKRRFKEIAPAVLCGARAVAGMTPACIALACRCAIRILADEENENNEGGS